MAGLPHLIRPMLASLRHELPEDEESYGWELKWDGLRAIAYVSEGTVRLVSRNDKEMAASYPELAVLADRVGTPVILDGEIVALHDGRPDFGLLQSRMHVQQPDDKLIRAVPVQMNVFDVLYLGHDSLLEQPYTQRRAELEKLGLNAARSIPLRGTAAARPACWPTASPRAWKEWSASR
jgi:bifunctional non-homologous end joining protein LigD